MHLIGLSSVFSKDYDELRKGRPTDSAEKPSFFNLLPNQLLVDLSTRSRFNLLAMVLLRHPHGLAKCTGAHGFVELEAIDILPPIFPDSTIPMQL
jgi:hypothetical protein